MPTLIAITRTFSTTVLLDIGNAECLRVASAERIVESMPPPFGLWPGLGTFRTQSARIKIADGPKRFTVHLMPRLRFVNFAVRNIYLVVHLMDPNPRNARSLTNQASAPAVLIQGRDQPGKSNLANLPARRPGQACRKGDRGT